MAFCTCDDFPLCTLGYQLIPPFFFSTISNRNIFFLWWINFVLLIGTPWYIARHILDEDKSKDVGLAQPKGFRSAFLPNMVRLAKRHIKA
jgi:hypothetical protein